MPLTSETRREKTGYEQNVKQRVEQRLSIKKVCFLSSGWLTLKPVGRPQYIFFFSPFFFCMKILSIFGEKNIFLQKGKKEVSSRTFF